MQGDGCSQTDVRELEDKLIIGHVYKNIKKYNMPGGVLVTRQASGNGVYTLFFSLLWNLVLSYSSCDVCEVNHVRYCQEQIYKNYIQGLV